MDLRVIGETLGVASLLEGSVRKQGNKVRITAQLIQASDGFHLWSKTFDGDLTDVFELQERIARGISEELKIILQGDAQTRLVPVATKDPEAYALFLQSTAALNQRDYERMGQAIGWLTQALKLDPKFARAHARLAMVHALGRERFGSSFAEGERHARLALEIDPSLGEPWAALGLIASRQRQFVEERAALDRGLEIDPNDAYVNLHLAQALIRAGYTRQGIGHLDRALAIVPVLPVALFWRGQQYLFAGDRDAAERSFQRSASSGMTFIASVGMASVAEARGDYAKARALAAAWPVYSAPCLEDPGASIPILNAAYYGGDAAERARAETVIAACLATKPARISAWVSFVALRFGPAERALEIISQPPDNDAASLTAFWTSEGRAARRSPGFAEFARKIGFADLWERYGAPDGCRRVAPRDYACD